MVDILRQQILYKANQMPTSSEEIKRNEDKEKGKKRKKGTVPIFRESGVGEIS